MLAEGAEFGANNQGPSDIVLFLETGGVMVSKLSRRRTIYWVLLFLRDGKSLFKICEKVSPVFDADRDTHQAVRHARCLKLFPREAGVSR